MTSTRLSRVHRIDTHLLRASVLDFTSVPARADTSLTGLLLTIPDLVALDLAALVAKTGYPGTAAIPATSNQRPNPLRGNSR